MKDQSVDGTGSKLQGHLNKMQKSLIGDAEPNTNNMLVDTDRTEDIHKMPQSTASTARFVCSYHTGSLTYYLHSYLTCPLLYSSGICYTNYLYFMLKDTHVLYEIIIVKLL